MNRTVSGAAITINVIHAFEDLALNLTDLKYTVFDVDGTVLIGPLTPVGFDPTKDNTDITIDGQYNLTTKKYDVRSLEVQLITANGTYKLNEFYEIEGDILKLTPFLDSFMSFPESMLVARRLAAPTPFFDALNDADKAMALENAYSRLVALKFNSLAGVDSLADIGPQQAAALSPAFVEALKRAQIMEANHMVEVNPVKDKIRMGIISETIGESSMFFKQKGVDERSIYAGISDQAYPLLSKYLYRDTSNSQIWKLRRS